MATIRFTANIKAIVNTIANIRYNNSRALGLPLDYPVPAKNHLKYERLGTGGEMAVALYLGIPTGTDVWFPWGAEDVAGYQVRTTANPNGTLKLRPQSRKDMILHREDPYILVVRNNIGLYELKGWIYGYEGIKEEYLKAPDPSRPPAYCVPIEALHPMDTLPTLGRGQHGQ